MSRDSLIGKQEEEYRRSSVVYATDLRFLQSLMAASGEGFGWNTAMLNLNICLSCTSKENANSNKEDMGPCSTGQLVGSTLHVGPQELQDLSDVNFDKATVDHDGSSAQQFEPLELHLEIGGGIRNRNVVSKQGTRALIFFMNNVDSLLLHDNSSISTVITKDTMCIEVEEEDRWTSEMITKKMMVDWSCLKWCRVERCPVLDTVFAILTLTMI